jgi:hypothetical protein
MIRSCYVFTLGFLMASGLAAAQTHCTPQQAESKRGEWVHADDDLVMGDKTYPRSQYAALLRKADRVIELLKQAIPAPTGLQAKAYRSVRGDSYTKEGPVPFGMNSLYLSYYCVPDAPQYGAKRGTIRPEDETGTWIYVSFNSIGWLSQEWISGVLHKPNGAKIYVEPHHAGEFQGTTLYHPTVHNPDLTEAIILTPDGSSPYKPLSREQYMLAREDRYDREIAEVEKELAHQAEYRDQGIASLAKRAGWSEDRKAHEKELYMKAYATAAAGLANRRRQIESDKAKFSTALGTMSAEERQQRAIVKDIVTMPGDRAPMFVSEEQGGHLLATLEKSAFEASGARDVPRIAVVYWRWTANDTNKKEMIRQFKERFDFKAVQQMLGK